METTLEEEQIQHLFDFRATYDRAMIELSRSLRTSTDRLASGPMAGPERDRELESITHLTEQLNRWQAAWEIFSSIRLAGVGEILVETPKNATDKAPLDPTIPDLSRELVSLTDAVHELSAIYRQPSARQDSETAEDLCPVDVERTEAARKLRRLCGLSESIVAEMHQIAAFRGLIGNVCNELPLKYFFRNRRGLPELRNEVYDSADEEESSQIWAWEEIDDECSRLIQRHRELWESFRRLDVNIRERHITEIHSMAEDAPGS